MTNYITVQETQYIALNVGPNKDNYAIECYFKHDLFTDTITSRYRLVKNWIHNEKKPDTMYKSTTKFREIMGIDKYHNLITIVKDIISKEGMEIQDPKEPFGRIIIYELK
jgi:hypothetical protein